MINPTNFQIPAAYYLQQPGGLSGEQPFSFPTISNFDNGISSGTLMSLLGMKNILGSQKDANKGFDQQFLQYLLISQQQKPESTPLPTPKIDPTPAVEAPIVPEDLEVFSADGKVKVKEEFRNLFIPLKRHTKQLVRQCLEMADLDNNNRVSEAELKTAYNQLSSARDNKVKGGDMSKKGPEVLAAFLTLIRAQKKPSEIIMP